MDFGFKNLLVWQKAIGYSIKVLQLTQEIRKKGGYYRLIEQVESSADSVPSNIAEGKGRFSKKEFKHFLYISRGSLYESVSQLNALNGVDLVSNSELDDLEKDALEIAAMLKGLINSIH